MSLMRRRELIIGLAAGTVLPFVPGCADNPALGRSQLMLISDGQLAQLSDQAWQDSLQRERVLRDPAYTRRLQRVGERVVQASGQTHHNWEFVVFDSDTVNAWVLPNGKVGFYKGILDIMATDDHLATVMGHEVGHVAGRHSAERASQQMAAQMGVSLLASAIGSSNSQYAQYSNDIGAALGMGVTYGIILPYSREHEYEADRLGVDYMAGSGYDPRQAVDFWIAMSTMNEHHVAEFASTHPSDESRIAEMRRHIQARGYA
ncbi:M48 family metallopeptidase [Maricaulis sp.]|uniref:M48 family metallopeptidase n=1 Tax=Maricaulis sp. TaxID=1486257 RepID=UPI00261F758F|nr:M48 family metallopeptidase [Maricaulis sp.]